MKWDEPVLLRFFRLQGKEVVEAAFNGPLNAIFLAWDVLVPGYAKEAWKFFRDDWPMTHPADSYWLNFREIADRTADAAQAWGLLYGIVITHVERLKKLLAERLDLESVPDPDWTDRAAMDLSREFERHRRYQSAKTPELPRTIEAYCKLRKASADGMADDKCQMPDGTGQMADGECQMTNGTCQMTDGAGQMPDGTGQMADGSGQMTHGTGQMTDGTEQMADDKCRMADGTGQMADGECQMTNGTCQMTDGACQIAEGLSERPTETETSPEKAPNEANLEMAQVHEKQGIASENRGPARRERSQVDSVQRVLDAMGNDRPETIVPADRFVPAKMGCGGASCRPGCSRSITDQCRGVGLSSKPGNRT